MCGIYGYVGADAALADPAALERALAALRHRGPDDRGTFHATTGQRVCGFAHTRLAIIDLSPGGHQPMATPDGRYVIVFNGEIYNYREIRAELEAAGDQLRTSSDTEVLLLAWARWGRGCLRRLRGMFAFAIWDAREESLFIARDRLGVKPLYYIERGRGVAFASEVRALIAAGAAPRRLARRAVVTYLAFGAVAGPDAIVEGVRSLPPGYTLELRGDRVTVERYWAPPVEPPRAASFEEHVEEIRPILREAVRLRLIADVPVGIFLSGGIDSSALVALATAASTSPVHTFTVTFDEEDFSEAPFAATVARHFGCNHRQVHLPASRAAQEIGDAMRSLDQPSADGVNTWFVAKAARAAGLTVALSGLGGDELFAGYDYFRTFRRARALGRLTGLVPAGLRALAPALARGEAVPNQGRKLAALFASSGRPEALYGIIRAMFTVDQRRALLGPELAADADYDGVTWPEPLGRLLDDGTLDPINAWSHLEIGNYLKNTLLRDSDVMSMAHALEVRVPLIDHVLVERVLGIPGPLKLSDHENKPLLIAAVPDLPREAVNRAKMGFTLPFDAWFRGSLRGWMEDVLLGGPIRRLGIFAPREVERLWGSFLRGERYTSHSRVWCVAALAAWCENNGATL